jgi:SAM-dependent methyltransferase
MSRNADSTTIASFGDEWSRHRQDDLDPAELKRMWMAYFHIFPWDRLPEDATGFDMGVGSGRWARLVAPRVGHLHAIDAAAPALGVARENLAGQDNVTFHHATTDSVALPDESCDFGYSLGVLHHIPDTEAAMADCIRLLRPGAPFLVYLYYRFDNRPGWFRAIWQASDLIRRAIHRLPPRPKSLATDLIAFGVYWPLSRLAWMIAAAGADPSWLPLSHYRNHSLTTLRTDSRDRFGTPLEHRFTRTEIAAMMQRVGLIDIVFSDAEPYWVALGCKGH